MSDAPELRQKSVFLDRTTAPNIVTLVLIAGIAAMSMNVFLPSMPSMALFFDADYAVIQLSISAYLALTGVLNFVIGPLSDRYGRRKVLLICIAVFTLASFGAMMSRSVEVFLAFRMAQAVIASGLVLSRAIVRDIVPANEAASMIAYVTMGMALVPMLAPVLGGFLEDSFGWQANFATMALSGILVFVLVFADLGETNRAQMTSFKAQFASYPTLLKSRRFWGYTFVAGVTSGAFFAFLGGAPYVGSEILGLSPSELGLYFGIIPTGYLVGNFFHRAFWRAAWHCVHAECGRDDRNLWHGAGSSALDVGRANCTGVFRRCLLCGLGQWSDFAVGHIRALVRAPRDCGLSLRFGNRNDDRNGCGTFRDNRRNHRARDRGLAADLHHACLRDRGNCSGVLHQPGGGARSGACAHSLRFANSQILPYRLAKLLRLHGNTKDLCRCEAARGAAQSR